MCKYPFMVRLIVIAILAFPGCKGSALTPNSKMPIAIPGVEAGPHLVGRPVHFFDNSSTDPNPGGKIVKYEWDWNNDKIWDEEGKDVNHSWDAPGTYYVMFRVTDEEGETDTIENPLEIVVENGDPSNAVDVTPGWIPAIPGAMRVFGKYTYMLGNGVHVFDTSDPLNPIWVDWIDTAGLTSDIAVSNGYAYIVGGGLVIVDISNKWASRVVKRIYLPTHPVGSIEISGSYAYISGTSDLYIVDVSTPDSPVVVKTIPVQYEVKDMVANGGLLYMLETTGIETAPLQTSSIETVDISNPLSAKVVSRIELSKQAYYLAVSNGVALATLGLDGLMVIDLSVPTSPQVTKIIDTPGLAVDLAISGGFVYVCDGHYGLEIVDISTPASAQIVLRVPSTSQTQGVAVVGSYVYLADVNTGIDIVDISTPGSARIVKTAYSLIGVGISISDRYAYLVDNYEGLVTVDISMPTHPQILNKLHIDHAPNALAVSGRYAYVGGSALRIFDLTRPEAPQLVRTIESISSGDNRIAVADGYAYVPIYPSELAIVDVSNPASAEVVNTIPVSASDIAVSGGYAYIASTDSGFQIVDVSDPASAHVVAGFATPKPAAGIAVSGGYAYVTTEFAGLMIVDISDPAFPRIVKTVDTPGCALHVAVANGYAYVADKKCGLQIIDISTPESVQIVKSVDTVFYATDVAISGNYAYLNHLDTVRLW